MQSINLSNLINHIHTSEPTLYILCGLPYSGKTYITDMVQKSVDVDLVRIDDIFARHGYNWDSGLLPDADGWGRIFNESHDIVKNSLTSGRSVLFDSTNHMRIAREALRDVARSVGHDSCVLYLPVDTETVWERYRANATNPQRSVIPEHLVQMTLDTLEVPDNTENGFVIITN